MSGKRADSRRDEEIAAAYASGLSLDACAAKFGGSKSAAKGAVMRTGTPLRRAGHPARLAGDAPAVSGRYLAGHSANAIARDLGVSAGAVARTLRQDGTEIRSRAETATVRHLREHGEYPWAAEAAARHKAGEPVGRLAREYRASWRAAAAAIGRQGVPVTRGSRGRPGTDPGPDGRAVTAGDFAPLNERFGFTVDAAASAGNARLPRYWTAEDDALRQPWARERVWANPPWSHPNLERWVSKAWAEWRRLPGPDLVVMLMPANRTDQEFWQRHVEPYRDRGDGFAVEFLPGRIQFLLPGQAEAGPGERTPFGCCLLIWGGS
jgi:phage N-6-adenine-methyltransferase